MMKIDIPYYEDTSRISNSNIGWFIQKGPAFLYKMLTNPPPEEKSPALERGTMIHEYILQPEEFSKDYVVWTEAKPTSAQQETFCKALAESIEIEPNRAILSAYKEAYSTTGKSDDKMLSEGLKIASTLKDYITFLKERDTRIMISPWDVKMLEQIKQNIDSHKFAKHLLSPTGRIINLHEFHINWEWYGEMPIACKSLLDGIILDSERKKITIFDLKTTQKLWHFEDSMKQYDYCRQLMYYTMAVKWYIKYELEDDPEKWTFDWYIIGIDTTGSYEIRVFKIDEKDILSRKDDIENALIDIAWHQSTNKWEHSRSYYEGDGVESLNI